MGAAYFQTKPYIWEIWEYGKGIDRSIRGMIKNHRLKEISPGATYEMNRSIQSIPSILWLSTFDQASGEARLTSKGVRHLLETFLDLQLPVQVLKLHHNRIAEGAGKLLLLYVEMQLKTRTLVLVSRFPWAFGFFPCQ